MGNHDSNKNLDDGFNAAQMERKLDITHGEQKWWRSTLDPLENRNSYSSKEVLAYRVLKCLIIDHEISPHHLSFSKSVINEIFMACLKLNQEELSEYIVIYSRKARTLGFGLLKELDQDRMVQLVRIEMKAMINLHLNEYYNSGNANTLGLNIKSDFRLQEHKNCFIKYKSNSQVICS